MSYASQPDSRNALTLYTTGPTTLTSDPKNKKVIVMLHTLYFCSIPGLNSLQVMSKTFQQACSAFLFTEKFS